MSRLWLSLLGGFSVTLDDKPALDFESDKVRALLAYLAMHVGRPQRREALAALLWPELSERRARHNLRQALFNLRVVIGDQVHNPPFLTITPQTIHLQSTAGIGSDVAMFNQAIAACREHAQDGKTYCRDCLERRVEAAALYHGHFLNGFTLKECQDFNEWALVQAQNLHQQAIGVLDWLVNIHHGLGRIEQMLAYARQWVALEPYDEAAHRAIMLALALNGQSDAALGQYATCRKLVDAEFGLEPDAETQVLYGYIAAGGIPNEYNAAPLVEAEWVKSLGACPYRGLSAFREIDAPLFFGREATIAQMKAWLQGQPAFTVILGPSGSGKSSVVYAGLLPQMRAQGDLLITEMRPGIDPFRALAGALSVLYGSDPGLQNLNDKISGRGERQGLESEDSWIDQDNGRETVLLIVDQFEELFTLCPEVETRHKFLDELVKAVELTRQDDVLRYQVLLTLRADFMGQALSYRPFADAIQGACLLMGPMNREELLAAIHKPAELRGIGFEAGLVERILDDVGDEPGNLPLLEFALTLLWERSKHGRLTHAAYEQIGWVKGALASFADQVYQELTPAEQQFARQVFLQLVQPGQGTEDTRRVALRQEFDADKWSLIQHLADRRLVVTGCDQLDNEYVEVAHEAMIQGWERLREWMRADRVFRVWQEGLRTNLRQWQASERHESALLRGLPLAEAESWLAERLDELSLAEQDYIRAGAALKLRRQKEQDRRRMGMVASLAAGLILALLAVFFIAQQRQEARRQASIGLASQAVSEIQGPNPERSVLLALEALEHYPYTWQAERALSQAVIDNRLRQILVHEDYVNTAEWSADGALVLTGSSDGALRVWEASSGQELWRISEGAPDFARWSPDGRTILAVNDQTQVLTAWDVATRTARFNLTEAELGGTILINSEQWVPWSPDGSRFLTYNDLGLVKIWDGQTGELLRTLESSLSQGERARVTSNDTIKILHTFGAEADQALWSPDGLRIAASFRNDSRVTVWDAVSGQELYAIQGGFENEEWRVYIAGWAPSGDRFATRGVGGAKVYDATSGELLLNLTTPEIFIYRAVWSPDGAKLLTSGVGDGTARVWDAETGEEIMQVSNLVNAAGSAWSSDGEMAAVGGNDNLIHILLLENPRQFRVFSGTKPHITILQFSPQNDRLLAVGDENLVHIYDLTEALVTEYFENSTISSVAWSPDGQQVALGYGGNQVGGYPVRVWDAVTGRVIVSLQGHTENIWSVQWSPTGELVSSAGGDQTVINWDTATWQPVTVFRGHDGTVLNSAWSPDGTRIASTSPGKVILWEARTGKEILTFSGHSDMVVIAIWSPDGSRILSGGSNGETLIWDAASGEVITNLLPEDLQLNLVAAYWSKDGKRIFLQTSDGAIRIFDTSTGKEQSNFMLASATASQISLSPQEDRLLKGDYGGAIVWDVAHGTDLLHYDYNGWVDAAYSPDGTKIAMASYLGTLEIFPTWQTTQELIDYAKDCCLVRELTTEERQLFGLDPLGE